jgi:hypothetical protein
MSKPTPPPPIVLTSGEYVYLQTGDTPFLDLPDKDRYSVFAASIDSRFRLTLHVEYTDGHVELISSGVQYGSHNYPTVTQDKAVRHVSHADWGLHEHEEIALLHFNPKVKCIALVLHTPRYDNVPGRRLYTTTIVSGDHMTVPPEGRRRYRVITEEAEDSLGNERHLVAVFRSSRALILEAPQLSSADPNVPLRFDGDRVTFGDTPDVASTR